MAKKMTDGQYRKLCRDMKHDLMSDGMEEINDSIYYDVAQCVLDTNPEVREYMLRTHGPKPECLLIEIIADDVASARR